MPLCCLWRNVETFGHKHFVVVSQADNQTVGLLSISLHFIASTTSTSSSQ